MYNPPQIDPWKGRKGTLHEVVQCVDIRSEKLIKGAFALLGFACDEGILRNQGRSGAAKGPEALRGALGKLALHQPLILLDLGDILCSDQNLEASQKLLGETIGQLQQEAIFPIVIGGGHELVWGHYLGLPEECGFLNIDAHFDLRMGQSNSGSSFAQIAEDRKKKGLPYDYLVVGIQPYSNSQELFDRAKELGVQWVLAENSPAEKIEEFIARNKHIYLTICLDVFAAAFAPGVSAPQSLGLNPSQVLPWLDAVAKSGKCVGFSVAELSPPLDQDNATARLAANLVVRLLHEMAAE